MSDPEGIAIIKRFIAASAAFGFLTAAALGLASTAAAAPLESHSASTSANQLVLTDGYVD